MQTSQDHDNSEVDLIDFAMLDSRREHPGRIKIDIPVDDES
jgi:hypothetical protein